MNNNMLLNLFNGLFNNNTSQNNQNYNNEFTPNITEYPATIFTNPQMSNETNRQYNSQVNNNQMANIFNIDALKNLLPIFMGKGGGGFADIVNKFSGENANLAQIFSALNKPKKKETEQKSNNEKPSLNLSEYIEIS